MRVKEAVKLGKHIKKDSTLVVSNLLVINTKTI